MTEKTIQIKKLIEEGSCYFDSSYFDEGLKRYKKALDTSKELLDEKSLVEIKDLIFDSFQVENINFSQNNLVTEELNTYKNLISFLDDYFPLEKKEIFIQNNYSNISNAILEAFLKADLHEKSLNFRASLDWREKALNLTDKITVNIGDMLATRTPYELLKQAKVAKLIGDNDLAEKYYNISLIISDRYMKVDFDFFKPYTEKVFDSAIEFFQEKGDLERANKLINKLISFLEDSYQKGDGIDFLLCGNTYVKKALLSNEEEKFSYFKKAVEMYNYLEKDDINDPFYYYIAYLEVNTYISLDLEDRTKSLEELNEFFLIKSTRNYGTYYYLKTLKELLITYFRKKELLKVFEIEKNLHINKILLRNKELEIYTAIEIFLKGCKSLLSFQRNIYADNVEEREEDAKHAYEYFSRLWKLKLISETEYVSLVFVIAKLYRTAVNDDGQAIFYLETISPLYRDIEYSADTKKTFAETFFELGMYHTESGNFQDSLAYLSKAIILLRDLFADNPIIYANPLHDALLNRAVTSYNFFDDYDTFIKSVVEGVEVLSANVQESTELIKLIKALSLKATIELGEEKGVEALKSYEKVSTLYHFYSFKNSSNLDKIYDKLLDNAILLADDLNNNELKEKFIKSKKSIKLFNI